MGRRPSDTVTAPGTLRVGSPVTDFPLSSKLSNRTPTPPSFSKGELSNLTGKMVSKILAKLFQAENPL